MEGVPESAVLGAGEGPTAAEIYMPFSFDVYAAKAGSEPSPQWFTIMRETVCTLPASVPGMLVASAVLWHG